MGIRSSGIRSSVQLPFKINVDITPIYDKKSKRFKTDEKQFKLVFQYDTAGKELDLVQIIEEIYNSLDRTITEIIKPYNENDYLWIQLENEQLDRDIYLPFQQIKYFSTNKLFDEISKVLQSKNEFILHGKINLSITIAEDPYIGGRKHEIRDNFINFKKFKRNSNKVIEIVPDGLCLPKAILLSIAHAEKLHETDIKEWRRLREDTGKILTEAAIRIMQRCRC